MAIILFFYSILPFCIASIGYLKGSEGVRIYESNDSLTKETYRMVKLLKWGGFVFFIMAILLRYYYVSD